MTKELICAVSKTLIYIFFLVTVAPSQPCDCVKRFNISLEAGRCSSQTKTDTELIHEFPHTNTIQARSSTLYCKLSLGLLHILVVISASFHINGSCLRSHIFQMPVDLLLNEYLNVIRCILFNLIDKRLWADCQEMLLIMYDQSLTHVHVNCCLPS